MLLYRCDGRDCGETQPGRGKANALPTGWVHVVINGRGMDLCLTCEKRRRAERDGT